MRTRFSFIDFAWAAIGVLLAAALFLPPQHAGERLGLRRFLTPEVSGEWRTAQRFRMDAPMLNGVEIQAAAVGPVAGKYRLTLRDRDARGVERVRDVDAAALVQHGSYLFEFEPIEDSTEHEFELEIAPLPGAPGRGVALWATRGARAEDSALRINNQPRWGSLAYQAHTPDVSLFEAVVTASDPDRPPRWLALLGLAGTWLALRFILRAAAAPDVRREPAPSQPAVT